MIPGAHVGPDGTTFIVYSMTARDVAVRLFDERCDAIRPVPLSPGDGGFHRCFLPGIGEGALYKLVLHARRESGRFRASREPAAAGLHEGDRRRRSRGRSADHERVRPRRRGLRPRRAGRSVVSAPPEPRRPAGAADRGATGEAAACRRRRRPARRDRRIHRGRGRSARHPRAGVRARPRGHRGAAKGLHLRVGPEAAPWRREGSISVTRRPGDPTCYGA